MIRGTGVVQRRPRRQPDEPPARGPGARRRARPGERAGLDPADRRADRGPRHRHARRRPRPSSRRCGAVFGAADARRPRRSRLGEVDDRPRHAGRRRRRADQGRARRVPRRPAADAALRGAARGAGDDPVPPHRRDRAVGARRGPRPPASTPSASAASTPTSCSRAPEAHLGRHAGSATAARVRRARPRPDRAARRTEEVLLLAGADAADLLGQLAALDAGDTLAVPPATDRRGSRSSRPERAAADPGPARCSSAARRSAAATTSGSSPRGLLTDGGKVGVPVPRRRAGVRPAGRRRRRPARPRLAGGSRAAAASQEPRAAASSPVGRLLADALGRLGIRPDLMAGPQPRRVDRPDRLRDDPRRPRRRVPGRPAPRLDLGLRRGVRGPGLRRRRRRRAGRRPRRRPRLARQLPPPERGLRARRGDRAGHRRGRAPARCWPRSCRSARASTRRCSRPLSASMREQFGGLPLAPADGAAVVGHHVRALPRRRRRASRELALRHLVRAGPLPRARRAAVRRRRARLHPGRHRQPDSASSTTACARSTSSPSPPTPPSRPASASCAGSPPPCGAPVRPSTSRRWVTPPRPPPPPWLRR